MNMIGEARVLVVDDDAMNRKIFAHLLMKTKIQVTAVSSGQECLDLVQREHFDIIFMDHLMPEMDGVETLQRLKSLENNLCKGTPVIALTANTFSGSREEYLAYGFDDFLSKPIVFEKLEALLQQKLDAPKIPESGTTDEITLPELEGVDWAHATQNIKDKDLLLQLLKNYYQDITDECEAISNLVTMVGKANEAINNYRIRVHSIKNTSDQLGITSVATLAKLLESAARDGELDKICAHNSLLLGELMKTKERLAPAMQEENVKSKELVSFSRISDSLDTLQFYISQMDIDNAFKVMEQIKSYAYSAELQEYVDRLAKKVSRLKFDEALEEIAKMREEFNETDANETLFF